jgi:integrase
LSHWPEADRDAFRAAFARGDRFDDNDGPGAHLADGTRRNIVTTYRRWLGFLQGNHPEDLMRSSAERITLERVRGFVAHLDREVRPTSVAMAVAQLCYAARLVAPNHDWQWLAAVKARLLARARPQDRFDRLVPPCQTLDFGIELMDHALARPATSRKASGIQYRDGLLLALISLRPIRRRSLAALTVSRHIEITNAGTNILLYAADTKSKRPDSFSVPERLIPYLKHYLEEIRPALLGIHPHDGLWASCKFRPLSGGRLYDIARARVRKKFGKDMGLHDFRRSTATYLAIDAPEMIDLIPGLLQHANPTSARHYNLAPAITASQRFAKHRTATRKRLRAPAMKRGA